MRTPSKILKEFFPESCHDRIFLVGGSVRDFLLEKSSQDFDLIAALSHDELADLGFRRVEPKSSVVIYFRFHPDLGKIEITRIASIPELENDLRQRDFTVNAIALELSGRCIDPLGGTADLAAGILRACTPQTFRNDPIRIFRAFRFTADGWQMAAETKALIREQDWDSELAAIPVERFNGEMIKALASENPGCFFELMLEFNVGKLLLPELFRMAQIPAGPLEHHPEGDLLTHSFQVLQRVAEKSPDPLTRFCGFFHDLGKLSTDPALYPKHHGHDEAGFRQAEEFCNRLRLSAAYRKALSWVSRLHGKLNRWEELRDSKKLEIAEQALKAGITDVLPLVSAADKPGTTEIQGWDTVVAIAGMATLELGIAEGQLETMAIGKRRPFIFQKRIERFRSSKNVEAV